MVDNVTWMKSMVTNLVVRVRTNSMDLDVNSVSDEKADQCRSSAWMRNR